MKERFLTKSAVILILIRNILQDRLQALKNYINTIKYSEFGWK